MKALPSNVMRNGHLVRSHSRGRDLALASDEGGGLGRQVVGLARA
jgi:hypothetical protein